MQADWRYEKVTCVSHRMMLDRQPHFQRVRAPTREELNVLVEQISRRVDHCLEHQG